MSPAAEISEFLAAMKADGAPVDEDLEDLIRRLCDSKHPAAIDAADGILAIVQRRDLALKERAAKFVPVLTTLVDSFGTAH